MKIDIIQIANSDDLNQAFRIRNQVFCVEQNVPYDIEMDEFDNKANHILAIIDGDAVGTARWRNTKDGVKFERFAVLKNYRGRGVGEALLEYLLKMLKDQNSIYLNAQESVIKFYAKYGFKVAGPRFFEASIPHKKMVFKP